MPRRCLRTCILYLLLAMAWNTQAGLIFPSVYSAAAIHLHVIDADTKAPLGGAVAIASWSNSTETTTLLCISMDGGSCTTTTCEQTINVVPGMSDMQGLLEIPSWSGKVGHCSELSASDPTIVIYRPGYEFRVINNRDAPHKQAPPVHSLLSGASLISSPWDGQTVELYRLGSHKYGTYAPRTPGAVGQRPTDPPDDNYVTNWRQFDGYLETMLAPIAIGVARTCFFEEGRPAVRILFAEERRLSPFGRLGGLDHYLSQSSDYVCGNQTAYLNSVREEVKDVNPLVPESYYVGQAVATNDAGAALVPSKSGHGFMIMPAPKPKQVTVPNPFPDAAPLPTALTGPGDAQSLAQANAAAIYHVDIDPNEPYFVSVTALVPLRYEAWCTSPSADKFPRKNFHNYRKREFVAAGTINDWDVPTYYAGCGSVAVLRAAQTEQTVSEESRVLDTYDDVHKRWTLSERIFPRSDQMWMPVQLPMDTPGPTVFSQLPEYLEVDGDAALDVVTDLKPAGIRRWELPAIGIHFTFSVCLRTSSTADSSSPAVSTSATPDAAARCEGHNP